MPANILKYIQQSLTESQQNQAFTNWGLGSVARLDYETIIPPEIYSISVIYPSGATCTITNGTTTYTAPNTSGSWYCEVDALGTWTITAVGAQTITESVTLASSTTHQSVTLRYSIDIIQVTIGSTTYTYTGTEISNSYVRITPSGAIGWKMWLYTSATVRFTTLNHNVDICAIGAGGKGAYYSHASNTTDQGGGAGGAGGVVTSLNRTLTINTDYSVIVGSGASTISSLSISAAKGSDGSGISGGSSGGNSGAGGNGAQSVDTGWDGIRYTPNGTGGNGVYAFGDSSFDGVVYAHGGEGGDVGYGSGARGSTTGVYANRGAGGAGGGSANNVPTSGINGVVLMRAA